MKGYFGPGVAWYYKHLHGIVVLLVFSPEELLLFENLHGSYFRFTLARYFFSYASENRNRTLKTVFVDVHQSNILRCFYMLNSLQVYDSKMKTTRKSYGIRENFFGFFDVHCNCMRVHQLTSTWCLKISNFQSGMVLRFSSTALQYSKPLISFLSFRCSVPCFTLLHEPHPVQLQIPTG